MTRACVMQLDEDFIAGGWSVSCFCGWEAETCWDDLLDAEEEYQRHRRSVVATKADEHDAALASAITGRSDDFSYLDDLDDDDG